MKNRTAKLLVYTAFATVYGLFTAFLFARIILAFEPAFFQIQTNPTAGDLSGFIFFFFAIIVTTYLATETILSRFFDEKSESNDREKSRRPVRRKRSRPSPIERREALKRQTKNRRNGPRTRITDG